MNTISFCPLCVGTKCGSATSGKAGGLESGMARSHVDPRPVFARRSEDIRLALRDGLFPLTLTLSLGEREQRALRGRKPTDVACSAVGAGFTLSPRERAGVRGNAVKSRPARRTN